MEKIAYNMNFKKMKEFIQQGEGIEVEFKLAQNGLPENLFETVCAFLNRNGGHVILGIDDDRNVIGINPAKIDNYIQQIVTASNNSNKLTPTFFLFPEKIEFQNKKLIYIFVPESSQVHSTSGKIYDRNKDGDFDITKNQPLVTVLYQKKQQTFTENKIYPYIELSDFRDDLFVRIRKMAGNNRRNHPWLEMNDMELMKSAGLYQKDYLTGQEGFTLAAALLLAKDVVIQSILPAYKTDAILRVQNLDRYDDRDDIRTNLIESYDRLMAFVQKHLPDKFFEGPDAQRRNLRPVIFHEVIANILVHREFTNPFPAKFIIETHSVKTENWCKPHGYGNIDPANFTPQTKNPNIAKFFREIGRFEELGSGVRNIFNFTKIYSDGKQPQLLEGDIFKIIIPLADFHLHNIGGLNDVVNNAISDAISEVVKERLVKIINIISRNPGCKISDLLSEVNISKRVLKDNIASLVNVNLIEYIGSNKTGGYYITDSLKSRINNSQ